LCALGVEKSEPYLEEMWAPLFYFCVQGMETSVQTFIALNGLPSEKLKRICILDFAIDGDKVAVVKKLLEAGIEDRYPISKSDVSAILYDYPEQLWTCPGLSAAICNKRDLEIVRILIQNGSDPHAYCCDPQYDETGISLASPTGIILAKAIESSGPDTLQFLLDYGLRLDPIRRRADALFDCYTGSIFRLAAEWSSLTNVKLLVQYGAIWGSPTHDNSNVVKGLDFETSHRYRDGYIP